MTKGFWKSSAAVVVAWVGLSGTCFAQVAQLSLAEAVAHAQEKSRRGELSQLAVEYAEAQYRQARSLYKPTVELLGHLHRRDDPVSFNYPALNFAIQSPLGPIPVSTPEQKIEAVGKTLGSLELSATLPLYMGGQRKSIIRQAELGRSLAAQGVRRTAVEVAFDVRRYFYGAQLAREQSALVRETVIDLETIAKITQVFFDNGSDSVDRGDVLRSSLSADMARSMAVQLDSGFETAVTALTHGTGYTWSDRIEPNAELFSSVSIDADLPELVVQANKFNPDINSMRLVVEVAQAQVDQSKGARRPVVALTGSAMHLESDLDGGLTNSENQSSWTLGIVVKMPLYDGGLRKNKLAAATVDQRRRQVQEREVSAAVAAQLRALLVQVGRATRSLEVAKSSNKNALEYHDLMLRAYQQGARELEDLLTAQFMKTLNGMALVQAQQTLR